MRAPRAPARPTGVPLDFIAIIYLKKILQIRLITVSPMIDRNTPDGRGVPQTRLRLPAFAINP